MTRLQPRLPGRRLPRLLAVAAVTLTALGTVLVGGARAAVANPGKSTFNRPSMVEAGGAEYLAYADTSKIGEASVAQLDSKGGIAKGPWEAPGNGTFLGTGPTIAAVHGVGVVVAWTDANGTIWVSEVLDGQFACVSHPLTLDRANGTPDADSGQTPYLSTEGDDGSGTLYLTWVDNVHSNVHITPLAVPSAAGCMAGEKITPGFTTNIARETAWGGPAWVVSGYGTPAERFWLIWSGTNAAHSISVAEYQASGARFIQVGSKVIEPYDTLTDIGGAYNTSARKIAISYCGTDHEVYYQEFTANELGGKQIAAGGVCDINVAVHNNLKYYGGGVGIDYDYSHHSYYLSWATGNSYAIQISPLEIS